MTPPTNTEGAVTDVAAIARGLSDLQRKALGCPPAWGLPLGHNQWFDLSYFTSSEPERFICNGEDMEHCIRIGLISVGDREDDAGEHLVDDDCDVEARWRLHHTDLGLAVRNHLTEQGVTAS